MRSAAVTLAAALLSCGGGKKLVPPGPAPEPLPLKIWIDPASGLPERTVLAGCEGWREKGILCLPAADRPLSDIQVYADKDDPCAVGKEGTRVLARAWRGGRIVFYSRCFMRNGKLDEAMLRSVGIHEVGHQLGIWEHVPRECAAGAKVHPDGRKVCGSAVMNPLYRRDVPSVTPVDLLAFDLRDRRIGVVIDAFESDPPRAPDCVYTAP